MLKVRLEEDKMKAKEKQKAIMAAINTLFELREDLTDENIFDLNELIKDL
jgi:cell division protein ZapA (FtsZ GTPase activity inhibitor)